MADNAEEVDDFLAHFGVLGMKWGHRRTPTGAPLSTNRTARLDAKASVKANNGLSYTARKVSRNTIAERSAKSKPYAKAVEYHLQREQKKADIVRDVKFATPFAVLAAVYGTYAFGPAVKSAAAAGSKWVAKQVLDKKFNDITKNF